MAQVKKEEIAAAIVEAAFELFKEKGYNGTTLPEIGRRAGISSANVYNYFESKLELLVCVYEPWLGARLDALEHSLRSLRSPRSRLRRILTAMWVEMPSEQNAFASNIVQALTTQTINCDYSPRLRVLMETRLTTWLARCLPVRPSEPARAPLVANLILMAFDGYAMGNQLSPDFACSPASIEFMVDALMRA